MPGDRHRILPHPGPGLHHAAGAIPGRLGSTITVWVEDDAHLADARKVLRKMQADAGDDNADFGVTRP
jgi:hypothetical protein